MYKRQVLFLASRGQDVTKEPIEIYGSDPYILGGHTGGGFWVDMRRMTTVPGLFAAGATAGGNPNKFVGGCCAEGKLAARGAVAYMEGLDLPPLDEAQVKGEMERVDVYKRQVTFYRSGGMEGIGGFPESGPENPLGVRGRNTFSIPQTALQLQREFHTVGVWRRYSVHKDTHSGYQGRGILNLSLPHGNALSCCFSILLYLFEIKRNIFQRSVSCAAPD